MANNKNLMSQLGFAEFSDQEYAQEFGVSPDDPNFNKKMFDRVEKMNYEAYLNAGMSEKMARSKAAERKRMAMNNLPKHVKL